MKGGKAIGIGIAIAAIVIAIIVITMNTGNQNSKSLVDNQTIASSPTNVTTSSPVTPPTGRHLQLNLTETIGIKGGSG